MPTVTFSPTPAKDNKEFYNNKKPNSVPIIKLSPSGQCLYETEQQHNENLLVPLLTQNTLSPTTPATTTTTATIISKSHGIETTPTTTLLLTATDAATTQTTPTTTSSDIDTGTATTSNRTTLKSTCEKCGHQKHQQQHNNIITAAASGGIMTHPISPLAKSQNTLELVEMANARQALIPANTTNNSNNNNNNNIGIRHNESATSLSAVPATLQVSRRPSLLLQEILTQRASKLLGVKKDINGQTTLRNSKYNGSLHGTATGSTVTIHTPGGSGAKSFQAKHMKEKNRRHGNDAISAALSALYCKLLVLLGLCLPITQVISDRIPSYVYQGFYVFLYAGSILFVIFTYASAFRNRSLLNALKNLNEPNEHTKYRATHFGSFYLRVGAIAFAIGTMVYSGLEFGQFFELKGNAGCRDVFIAITPILRMLLCIAQVQFIFLNTTYLDMARHKVTSRFGLMHMAATNLCEWLYVLVEETKHEIFHIGHHDTDPANDPVLTGGAHGGVDWVAMNASLHVTHHAVDSVAKSATLYMPNNSISNSFSHNTNNNGGVGVGVGVGVGIGGSAYEQLVANVTAVAANSTSEMMHYHQGCTRTNIMGALVQEVSPFLFPCTIEYSLICAVILYEMWKTVKSIPDIDKLRKNSIKPAIQKPEHHFSVDCSQSHRGLFFGILVIVMTIISMIMYFVLYTQPGYELIATQEVTLWETAMYFLCSTAVIAGIIVMRDLKYTKGSSDEHHSMELDCMLLVVAQTGVYLYAMFSILGSYYSSWDTVPDRIEGIVGEVFGLAQTSLQTMFILHTSHRRCKGAKQVRQKPGREIITFLLVANIAIWFINTLIKGRAVFRETHMEFFGVWGWTIITHVSMPLAIFYRFHSTICLFEVWKVTYKSKVH